MAAEETSLIGLGTRRIVQIVTPLVDRPFRARQVAHWIIHRNATSFDEMTDLPKELRRRLDTQLSLTEPRVVNLAVSRDESRKYLYELGDGSTIEAVAMAEAGHHTLCLSSQSGCAVGCTFCVTGVLGAGRNLSPEEIVGQYRTMLRDLGGEAARVNIVFMGMGEPLLNPRNLMAALEVLYETVSPRRITVSTSGVLPGIRLLGELERRPKLAVSLNAPTQELREEIMPISRQYPLDQLMACLRAFPLERGRRITFEYVLIRGLNDGVAHADELSRLLRGIPSKINLIPLNEDPIHLNGLRRPDDATVGSFAERLRDCQLTVTVRWSKGSDVGAACGQLKGLHQRRSTASDHCRPAAAPSRR
jgi:23S rRNA (adenine2503-C2)-methyltransferase